MKPRRGSLQGTSSRFHHQYGVALLIILLAVLGIFGLVLVSSISLNSVLIQRQKSALPALDETRLAIVGYSIGNMSSGQRPGTMPMPDSFASTESPANYDGSADGGCLDASKANGLPLIATGVNMRCLGRLPWKDLGISLPAPSENDVAGLMPWYAVSGNLVDPTCLPVLNSNTLAASYAAYGCPSAALPYPWLTVRDSQGNVLSNRVAVVLIIPGPPLVNQSRPASPNLASASQYLDSVTIGGTVYSNADMDNDFIIGEQSSTFNDVVTYITIDDLMRDVESAAASTALAAVATFKNNHTAYPWLAAFDVPSAAASYVPAIGSRRGLLPVYVVNTPYPTGFQYTINQYGGGFSYSSSGAGTVTTTAMNNLTNSTRIVSAAAGKCQWTSDTTPVSRVLCVETITTGLPGSVARREVTLDFTALNASQVTVAPASAVSIALRNLSIVNAFGFLVTNSGYFEVKDYNGAGTQVGRRAVTGGNASLVQIGNITMPLNAYLPAWFADNRWHEVMYGAIAAGYAPGAAQNCVTSCLTVGQRTDIKFAVIAAGGSLATQTRPTANLSDYLEALGTVSNADGDDVFTASHVPKSTTFNDQVFPIP
jgi:hypothetical protein